MTVRCYTWKTGAELTQSELRAAPDREADNGTTDKGGKPLDYGPKLAFKPND